MKTFTITIIGLLLASCDHRDPMEVGSQVSPANGAPSGPATVDRLEIRLSASGQAMCSSDGEHWWPASTTEFGHECRSERVELKFEEPTK